MKFLLTVIFLFTIYLLFPKYVSAVAVCQNNSRTDGFLTSYDFNPASQFGNRFTKCIVDPRTYISTQKLKYTYLKEQYFSKAKITSTIDKQSASTDLTETNLTTYLSGTKDVLVNTTGTVRINNPIAGSKTGIFFIDGDLEFQSDVTYGTGTTGLVFVVNGNVRISRLVSTINAVIISEGIIYTTWDFADASRNSQPAIGAPNPLTVNGTLVVLSNDPLKKARFNRTLADNSIPAEQVLFQPKYLIIIKGLMTDTITFQQEVAVANFATPFPTAPPAGSAPPSPTSSPAPSGNCQTGGTLSISTIQSIATCVLSIN